MIQAREENGGAFLVRGPVRMIEHGTVQRGVGGELSGGDTVPRGRFPS
ncbi:hypothetical protein RSSM_01399 [Rhodopirellula sallentina SM41]|uniref:Uncharacterized protein n=1 Tax=Rhodopirellula sallentina SM41 TaxID=1263870 RepID=M5UH46_9BACT|nr:hypothetical protein RSSM_01399 [Rhodopirellula sallentina SM41]